MPITANSEIKPKEPFTAAFIIFKYGLIKCSHAGIGILAKIKNTLPAITAGNVKTKPFRIATKYLLLPNFPLEA